MKQIAIYSKDDLLSCWNEAIQNGHKTTFEEYFNRTYSDNVLKAYIDELAEEWAFFKGVLPQRRRITQEIRAILSNAILRHSQNNCLQAIQNYATVLRTNTINYKYEWDIILFFSDSKCAPLFFDDGEIWQKYLAELNKSRQHDNH